MLLVLEDTHVKTLKAALLLYLKFRDLIQDQVVRIPGHEPQLGPCISAVGSLIQAAAEPPKYVATNTYIYSVLGANTAFELRDPAGNGIGYLRTQEVAELVTTLLNQHRTNAASPPVDPPTIAVQRRFVSGKHGYSLEREGKFYHLYNPEGGKIGEAPNHSIAADICAAMDQYVAGNKPCDAYEVGRWLHTNKRRVAIVNEDDVVELERCVYAQQDDNLLLVTKKLEDDSKIHAAS